MLKTDVVVIGAGAVGCAVARELSKYEVDVIVVDKNEDVGGDASKSNSAIIHTGYDAAPGTLESQLVVAANPMYDEIVKDLDIPFARIVPDNAHPVCLQSARAGLPSPDGGVRVADVRDKGQGRRRRLLALACERHRTRNADRRRSGDGTGHFYFFRL